MKPEAPARPQFEANGDTRVPGFTLPVSRLVSAEAAAFQRALFDSAGHAIIGLDPEGTITTINDGASRLVGIASGRLVDVPLGVLLVADETDVAVADRFDALRSRVAADGSGELELTLRGHDGRMVFVSASLAAIDGADGGVTGYVLVAQDIGRRKAAETAARRDRAFLEAVIDAVPAAVFVKDRAHRWLLMSEEGRRLLGRPGSDFIGATDAEFYTPEQVERYWAQDDAVLDGGRQIEYHEKFIRPDGERRWLLKSKRPVVLEDGEAFVVGVMVCAASHGTATSSGRPMAGIDHRAGAIRFGGRSSSSSPST